MDASNFYFILMIFLGILFPIYSIWDGPKTKKLLIKNPDELTLVYKQTLIIQVVLTLLVFLALYFNNDLIDVIGLGFLGNVESVFALLLICFLFLWLINSMKFTESDIETLKMKYKEVIYIIPRNKAEFRWSVILSFSVGAMEEILYRGFLFWQLTLYIPVVAALIVTNLIFGILHIGTGMKNAVSTFWLGMIYSAISIPFDTLWFAILAHILIDIYAVSIGFKVNKSLGH